MTIASASTNLQGLVAAGLSALCSGNDLEALATQARQIYPSSIDLAQINAFTLAVAGIDDAPARHPDRLAAAIPGARWQAVHGNHLDAARQPALLEAVNEFLGA
jgi:hypothetical protein